MRVSIVNSLFSGGAANSAKRLHVGLRRMGVESRFYNAFTEREDEAVVFTSRKRVSFLRRVVRRIERAIGCSLSRARASSNAIRTSPNHELFSDFSPAIGEAMELDVAYNCDILNLHWLTWNVDLRLLFRRVAGKIPLVWTLHDMRPFTGGCHYDSGCGRFSSKCGNCPQLIRSGPRDASDMIFKLQTSVFRELGDSDLTIVTPSKWLAGEVSRSSLLSRFQNHVVPYGVDTESFHPVSKAAARVSLGLREDAFVLLFVSESVGNHRKGFDLLKSSLSKVEGGLRGTQLVTVGGGPRPDLSNYQLEHIHFGSVASDRILSIIYSASDIFVVPSRQDNLPNTILESLACGTPVVGFSVGGVPEIVRRDSTGWLAAEVDAESLAETILQARHELKLGADRIRSQCRLVATEEYAMNVQARAYIRLFSNCLSEAKRSGLL